MEMGRAVLMLLFFSTIVLYPSSLALPQDGHTLLEIKSTLNDTRNFLSNWRKSDESHCTWTGITCHPGEQRVRSMYKSTLYATGGIISPSIGKLSRLHRLALHQNGLHGVIPNEIGNCTELRALYLRANYLQGGIPSDIGNLSYLHVLDLSSNSLKGAIPSSIGRLTQLRLLNLSTNFFSGEIPDVGVLSTFGNNAFIGNLDLCGQQVQKPCRTSLGFPVVLPHAESDEAAGKSNPMLYTFSNNAIPSYNINILILLILNKVPARRSSHYVKWLLVGAITIMGLVLVITLSSLWICLLSKKERAARRYIEVKDQLNPESSRKDDGAKLITFHGDLPYTSFEIIEKLESLDEDDVVGSGGFGTVYRMVMNDCGTFAVKRIDRSREGSDQGFERELEILGSIKHINLVNLRGYCRLPSTKLLIYDYLAMGSLDDLLHEYLQSGRATEKSDVYSFGVLLLELVTGKRPTDPTFASRGVNVVGWMNAFLKENRLEEVVDKRCSDADSESVEVILEMAASCTDANADERPTMNQVLQILEQEVMSPCPSDFYESHSDH
ncbi:hypothetical protein ACSQ67_019700 [Phaseolus vulgaris]